MLSSFEIRKFREFFDFLKIHKVRILELCYTVPSTPRFRRPWRDNSLDAST